MSEPDRAATSDECMTLVKREYDRWKRVVDFDFSHNDASTVAASMLIETVLHGLLSQMRHFEPEEAPT